LLGIVKLDPKEKEGLLKSPSKSSFLTLLWGQVRPEFETAARLHLAADTSNLSKNLTIDAATFIPKLTRLAKPERNQALTDYATGSGRANDRSAETEASDLSAPANLETDIGTLVHRYLEMIATDGLDVWPAARIEEARPYFQQWFASHGYGQEECVQASDDVRNNLVSAISSTTGRWILGPHESAECEAGITTTENGISRSHIVDRTFVEDGIRWVIDYKTTRYKGEDLEGFLKERAESYREQMVRYASLYQSAGQVLKVAIYFVSEDRRYEFDF
jgi:ATP-dependent exoDNAse (exonuclease V) beta subunit